MGQPDGWPSIAIPSTGFLFALKVVEHLKALEKHKNQIHI
jgi:hypothetical protein